QRLTRQPGPARLVRHAAAEPAVDPAEADAGEPHRGAARPGVAEPEPVPAGPEVDGGQQLGDGDGAVVLAGVDPPAAFFAEATGVPAGAAADAASDASRPCRPRASSAGVDRRRNWSPSTRSTIGPSLASL